MTKQPTHQPLCSRYIMYEPRCGHEAASLARLATTVGGSRTSPRHTPPHTPVCCSTNTPCLNSRPQRKWEMKIRKRPNTTPADSSEGRRPQHIPVLFHPYFVFLPAVHAEPSDFGSLTRLSVTSASKPLRIWIWCKRRIQTLARFRVAGLGRLPPFPGDVVLEGEHASSFLP